jgi:general stress protein CsbA
MIEYAVSCLPMIFFFIYISRNDTELTHRNTYLIKEKERYSAIIMQSSMFFCIMFVIIFSKISFGVRYIDNITSIIISLFIIAGLFLKAYTNKIKSGSCLTSISLSKLKIMDKGMDLESEDDDDEEEEEVFVNEDGEEIVTEKRKLLKKKEKKVDDDLTEKEKEEMEKYLATSPDQDIVDHIQKPGLYQKCRYPEFFAYLLVFTSFSLLYTSNIFSVPVIGTVLVYIILIRVNELDNYYKSLLVDYEKEWAEYVKKTKKFITFIY